jgi:flagellar motor switch/type III secretory pathway protein FliN
MTTMANVELFDFRDASELSQAAELRASEALRIAIPRAALVLSTITRRSVGGQLTRFELTAPDEVAIEGCDAYDITMPMPAAPGLAATRHPIGTAIVPRVAVTGLSELLMGGPGDGEDRLPTRFERNLLCRRLSEALLPLWDALGLQSLEAPGLAFIDNPVPELPLSTVAVGICFSVGERTWELTLALASAVVDASLGPPPAQNGATMAKAVKDVPVELAVGFGPIKVSAADLERIAPGDVIHLDHGLGTPLVAVVEGRPMLLVRHGTTGRRLAVEVLQVLDGQVLAQPGADVDDLHDGGPGARRPEDPS